ncbi:hypothetical protein ACFQI3_01855 [Hansschlegelia quercus]|uniref:DUF3551 domain-containing protein n=1 Tax=Hansschlegelia quercus TaxID=2528245 RepID=A0A4V2JEC7_9HYPH|nr:hypothetical protein [Hansschlegelia quercus]TBN54686.1 hypothetical protein EYR15_00490 [Hansschlegelia quercus]
MSLNAFRIAALIVSCLAAGGSHAAERILGSRTIAECAPAETVVSEFAEQVCYRGPNGYEACRWLPRTHIVDLPETCGHAGVIARAPLVRK